MEILQVQRKGHKNSQCRGLWGGGGGVRPGQHPVPGTGKQKELLERHEETRARLAITAIVPVRSHCAVIA